MAKQIDTGHYQVSLESSANKKKNTEKHIEFGVIRGDIANNFDRGVFGDQFGFKNSKWYAYKLEKTSVLPSLNFSATAPRKAFKKKFSELKFAQQDFGTKRAAITFLEVNWL